MFLFLATIRHVKEEESLITTISSIYTKDGLKLADVIPDEMLKIIKTYKGYAKPSQPIKPLLKKILPDVDFSEVDKNYGKYARKTTTIGDLVGTEFLDSVNFADYEAYIPYAKRALTILGYDGNKLGSLYDDLKSKKYAKMIQDYLDVFNLPLDYIFKIGDLFIDAITKDDFTLEQIPPYLQMDSGKVMSALTNLQTYLADDTINIANAAEEIKNILLTIEGVWEGVKKLITKTLLLVLTPINRFLPSTSDGIKSKINDIVALYDDMIKDTKFSDLEIVKNAGDIIIKPLRESLKTGKIQFEKQEIELDLILNTKASILEIVADDTFKVPSILSKTILNNGDLVQAVKKIVTTLNISTEEDVDNIIRKLNDKNEEILGIITKSFTDSLKEFLEKSTKLPDFIGLIVSYFDWMDLNFKVVDFLTNLELKKPDWPSVKKALNNFADGLMVIDRMLLEGPISIVADTLKKVSNVLNDDVTFASIIKCAPLGDLYVEIAIAAQNIAEAIPESHKESKSYMRKVAEERSKKSVKDALDGIKIYGLELYATLEKLSKIDKLNLVNIADSLVVSDGWFADFQKGLKKIINDLPKNKKITFKDTLTTCAFDYDFVMKATSPVAEYITWTSADPIQFVTNVNVTILFEKLHSIASGISKGEIKYDNLATAGETLNKDVYPALQQASNPETDKEDKGLSGGAIAGIVIGVILGIAIIAGSIFAVFYFMKKKNDEKTAQGPEV